MPLAGSTRDSKQLQHQFKKRNGMHRSISCNEWNCEPGKVTAAHSYTCNRIQPETEPDQRSSPFPA
jgi:hypothetical protein